MPSRDFDKVTFAVEDGDLVMHAVAKGTGKPYRHACPLASFEAVAHELDAAGAEGITRDALHERTGLPWSRIQVALVFMDERSILDRRGRRGGVYVPGSASVHMDAMTEYHALREGAAEEPQ